MIPCGLPAETADPRRCPSRHPRTALPARPLASPGGSASSFRAAHVKAVAVLAKQPVLPRGKQENADDRLRWQARKVHHGGGKCQQRDAEGAQLPGTLTNQRPRKAQPVPRGTVQRSLKPRCIRRSSAGSRTKSSRVTAAAGAERTRRGKPAALSMPGGTVSSADTTLPPRLDGRWCHCLHSAATMTSPRPPSSSDAASCGTGAVGSRSHTSTMTPACAVCGWRCGPLWRRHRSVAAPGRIQPGNGRWQLPRPLGPRRSGTTRGPLRHTAATSRACGTVPALCPAI